MPSNLAKGYKCLVGKRKEEGVGGEGGGGQDGVEFGREGWWGERGVGGWRAPPVQTLVDLECLHAFILPLPI